MQEITQGRINRYASRAIQVRGGPAFEDWAAQAPDPNKRRQTLQSLRDLMSHKRQELRRASRRRGKEYIEFINRRLAEVQS